MIKKLRELKFYKDIWFWTALVSVIYILRSSKLLKVNFIFDIVMYSYTQVVKEPIAFLALGLSFFAVYIERINVVKNDRRSTLSISYKLEDKVEVKTNLGKKIKVPRLRIFENSGVINTTYILTPYINDNDFSRDEIGTPYFSFNAVHMHLNEPTNSFKPAKLHYENYLYPNSIIFNNPKADYSHFCFALFRGNDGTYKLLMLVYRKHQTKGVSLSDIEYDLQIIDRVDALNKGAKEMQDYYDQFKKCEQYLKDNGIIIS